MFLFLYVKFHSQQSQKTANTVLPHVQLQKSSQLLTVRLNVHSCTGVVIILDDLFHGDNKCLDEAIKVMETLSMPKILQCCFILLSQRFHHFHSFVIIFTITVKKIRPIYWPSDIMSTRVLYMLQWQPEWGCLRGQKVRLPTYVLKQRKIDTISINAWLSGKQKYVYNCKRWNSHF